MAKKPDLPEKSEEDKQLVERVDGMMNVKGPAPGADEPLTDTKKTPVSEVAANVNESLAEELSGDKVQVKVTPKTTAPELPKELKGEEAQTKPEPEVEAEPVILPEQPAEQTQPEAEPSEPPAGDEFNDSATDKAVDDIAASESDMVLAVEDAQAARKNKQANSNGGWKDKLRALARNKWTWVVAGLLLLVVFALPFTRYKVLGLVVKKTVTISVIDSKTATPVSNAEVELGGSAVKTDANGKAKVKAGLGKRDLVVNKSYYQELKQPYFVGFKSAPSSQVKLVATGRLVPVVVVNKITGKPVSGAVVQVSGTSAKTSAKGTAVIALPTKSDTVKAKLVSKGYNSADVTVQVTDRSVKANTFELTPAGQVYFLSNRSGNLDVVKSNLDGSGRKTVFAGTGKEDRNTTSLLASRDWRYLVLKAKREGANPALYLIDTSNDKVTQFDNGDAEFSLIGWYDHNFIYSLTRNNQSLWQAGRQVVKSYDADHLQLNQVDQNQAEGNSGAYAYQDLSNFYIVDGAVVYSVLWSNYSGGAAYDMAGKNSTIRSIQAGGQNKKDHQTFAGDTTNFIRGSLYEPNGIYYAVYSNASSNPAFYKFENQSVATASIDLTTFNRDYPTFLLSPSGKQTFWTELRDGKNALFTGDSNADNKKQIATASEYAPYGWYGDGYVLVSKNSSELYVSSPDSLNSARKPLKVTDYYKPAQTYEGYGYGYGGL